MKVKVFTNFINHGTASHIVVSAFPLGNGIIMSCQRQMLTGHGGVSPREVNDDILRKGGSPVLLQLKEGLLSSLFYDFFRIFKMQDPSLQRGLPLDPQFFMAVLCSTSRFL